MNNHQQNMTEYNAHFLDSLIRSGVAGAVISPGSRSTPMALLMEEHPRLKTFIQVDERSAGFFALGLAKSSRKPVALLCTSGTAAANYMPAVAEARISRVPLIVLTSDRPPELRDNGAPQTIDQNHLYGHTAKWFAEMALPDADPNLLTYARTQGARAVYEATKAPAGPVQLNFPYREPLLPDYDGVFDRLAIPAPVQLFGGRKTPDAIMVDQVAASIQTGHGIIIAGEMVQPATARAVKRLADVTGWPLIADPLSQLRVHEDVIDSYDAFLRDDEIKDALKPAAIIRVGALPVSKALSQFMKRHEGIPHVVIEAEEGWRDPHHVATHMVHADERLMCEALAHKLPPVEESWLALWLRVNEAARAEMKQAAAGTGEAALFAAFLEALPEGASLFTGNSMPIRDLDSFLFAGSQTGPLHGNRGANGIDGLVSSAAGIAANGEQVYAVLGDLSFFHDVNGLLGAKMNELNMTIFILNNNGGGIFSYLPQAGEDKHFERLFGTPSGLLFHHAAALYGCDYKKITSAADLSAALSQPQTGVTILEAFTDRAQNTEEHRMLWKNAVQAAKRAVQ